MTDYAGLGRGVEGRRAGFGGNWAGRAGGGWKGWRPAEAYRKSQLLLISKDKNKGTLLSFDSYQKTIKKVPELMSFDIK